jgi:hypothetical protein
MININHKKKKHESEETNNIMKISILLKIAEIYREN